jgi:hypothetical protein
MPNPHPVREIVPAERSEWVRMRLPPPADNAAEVAAIRQRVADALRGDAAAGPGD